MVTAINLPDHLYKTKQNIEICSSFRFHNTADSYQGYKSYFNGLLYLGHEFEPQSRHILS